MLKSLFGVIEDVVKIGSAPIEIALDLTKAVTKPIAEVTEAIVDEVKDLTK